MHALWTALHEAVTGETRAVLVSVLAVEGSAPREAGARMIVTEAGLRGTIGGGTLEHQAWQAALALLRALEPRAQRMTANLGPDLGQCCGGRVTVGLECFSANDTGMLADYAAREAGGLVLRAEFASAAHAVRTIAEGHRGGDAIEMQGENVFIERFRDQRTRLHLFGAGHVGTALTMALAPLPFAVLWYDERADMFPARVPANAEMRLIGDPSLLTFAAGDHVLVMTHSHPLDLALVAAALRSPAHFIGVIGSSTKKARFLSRLRAAGFSQTDLPRMVCPIGVTGIAGKEPAVIAASVAAQMLAEREKSIQDEKNGTRRHHARIAMGLAG